MSDSIVVVGAREHNLQDVSVSVPRGTLTVFTGVSGSGKSSLAVDTIFAESQRRFLESLSSYARQFLGQLGRPAVDHLEGLSPAIAIDQKRRGTSRRSTVGTVTEIHAHLRLLYARLGVPHCPDCGERIGTQTSEAIGRRLLDRHRGKSVLVMAPVVHQRKGEYRKELDDLRGQGFVRVMVDGELRRLDERFELARYEQHTLEVIMDRLVLRPSARSRLDEAVERAVEMTGGTVSFRIGDETVLETTQRACPECGVGIPEMEPRLFSFNSPIGACPACDGLGYRMELDLGRVIPDPGLSVREGCFAPQNDEGMIPFSGYGWPEIEALARYFEIDLDQPWRSLGKRKRKILLEGSGNESIEYEWVQEGRRQISGKTRKPLPGILSVIQRVYEDWHVSYYERFMNRKTCSLCAGERLNDMACSVRFRDRRLPELSCLSILDAEEFFNRVEETLEGDDRTVGGMLVAEIRSRLRFLLRVGLGYLCLDRGARTLAGGEMQRIRLARQLGSGLQGILYVLDEPSIGLHSRDNERLIRTLQDLRDQGNSVFVIEHDEETIRSADHVVDIGPGAGRQGGLIVAEGTSEALANEKRSITGDYLARRVQLPWPEIRRVAGDKVLRLLGASQHNLKDLDVSFPLGLLTVVSGVSGSGKSTLVTRILQRALCQKLGQRHEEPGEYRELEGVEWVDRVIEIDQSPIGRTPRSNPATYTKVFDLIRDLFSQMPLARARGYSKGRFSFNRSGGRCEACQGAGVREIEMQFLPDVTVVCEECRGRRYNRETLDVEFRGHTIRQILELTVSEALELFENQPAMLKILRTMDEIGLGYVLLGQPSTTLSGGEAQRIKIARELRRQATGRTLYVLDEPTTGLHFADIARLLECLGRLVEGGNTVVVIEHNLDVLAVADHVIDLGPEGGEGGGELVYAGPFEKFLDKKVVARSHTAKALARHARQRSRKRPGKPTAARRRRDVNSSSRRWGREHLKVEGATHNNLKGLTVQIPRDRLTVVTGVSGSGKSSLVLDTIFAEGQKRFLESLSTYARRFLGRVQSAPVERIQGLGPAISIDQKSAPATPRSTVATATEIHDSLRLLFSRIGRPHCPGCKKRLQAWSPARAARQLMRTSPGKRVRVLVPLNRREDDSTEGDFGSDVGDRLSRLREDGFVRVQMDGETHRLEEVIETARWEDAEDLSLVVDRIRVGESSRARLAESIEQGYRVGGGIVRVDIEGDRVVGFGEVLGCADCEFFRKEELTPRMFSFNHQQGACSRCQGLGVRREVVSKRVISHRDRGILDGAVSGRIAAFVHRSSGEVRALLEGLAKAYPFDLKAPYEDLPPRVRHVLLHGWGTREVSVRRVKKRADGLKEYSYRAPWPGLIGLVERWYERSEGGTWARRLESLFERSTCRTCRGERLRPENLSVWVGKRSIADLNALTIHQAFDFFRRLRISATERQIAEKVLDEILSRLKFLVSVGLDYLTLDRTCGTLSGGEAQRIRLASQLGSRLVGVLYCLDEPTIGLHPRDTGQLMETLEEMRDRGNTVLVVEHDLEVIRRADHVVDIGPGAGRHGGQVVASGTPESIEGKKRSLTGMYLRGDRKVMVPATRREPSGELRIQGARKNNLKNLNVPFPRGVLTAVTGVSGSGKSTLVMDCLVPALRAQLDRTKGAVSVRRLLGWEGISRAVVIDQKPIGRTPKSNAATYTGIFDSIRTLFASTPQSRMKGFKKGRFSFNLRPGRCGYCEGGGAVKVEMHFLPDVWLPCRECHGKRYNSETLSVRFLGKTVADVLEMEVGQALELFDSQPRIRKILQTLSDVGLEYLALGQPGNTLSGGEAQRVKLSRELATTGTGETLYVLDEPTTGLHLEDVRKLMEVLHRLVEEGHTVVVIEHHLDVIFSADHLIDLGPEGGDEGGKLVVSGTPEFVMGESRGHTGKALRARFEGL